MTTFYAPRTGYASVYGLVLIPGATNLLETERFSGRYELHQYMASEYGEDNIQVMPYARLWYELKNRLIYSHEMKQQNAKRKA